MNDLHHPCEEWHQPVSLAAAGCLTPDEEREVRLHIETCSTCRQRFRELTELCGGLAAARPPAEGAEAAIVTRVMSAVVSDESGRSVARTRTEMIHPTLLSRSLDNWRWIMRSRVSRVAAAAIFVLAITGVAWWFQGGGATPALADFLEPILEARTVKFKMATELKGPTAVTSNAEVMWLDGSRHRTVVEHEMEKPIKHKSKSVTIWDGGQGKSLHLHPSTKRATIIDYVNRPKDKTPNQDPVAGYRELLLDVRDKPDVEREPLGEKEIDGHRVVGFRVTSPTAVISIWGDPKTGLPVRIETTTALVPNAKVTMSEFEFNVEMDESLFSLEPPAGYEVTVMENSAHDDSTPEEKHLIEMFRLYSELCGGLFPDVLELGSLLQTVNLRQSTASSREDPAKPEAKRSQENSEFQTKLQQGLWFALMLPKDADWHYAGRGATLGEAETPIFWYRPKDAKAYRVVYADLSVREVETPPSEPVADPGQPEKDMIEMFRCYSELNGGTFPNSLETVPLMATIMTKMSSLDSQEQPEKPSAQQERKMVEDQFKLERGLRLVLLLPKEADSRYVGRGVSLGAADTPIFWYRPEDAKEYRVVFGDLSVRDAETHPDVSEALPEQDLIDTLRYYCELSEGPFPDSLEAKSLMPMVMVSKMSSKALENLMESHSQEEIMASVRKIQPGLTFVSLLPPEAGAHYAGKGVSLGAADTPIFWYRPDENAKYRVVYGDLSVREAETPPSVPETLPEPDLIGTLRYYSELSGGPLPDSLDSADLKAAFQKALVKKFRPKKGQKPSGEQIRESMKAEFKIRPGLEFLASLPPEADAHYAGKGVSLGAAKRPIFWYRPKDSKKYRVVYGDLSVGEAEAAPSVPGAERVPTASDAKE